LFPLERHTYMEPPNAPVLTNPNRALTGTMQREASRLAAYIKTRVNNAADAEDVLQDVFFELLQAYRLPESIEQVSSWLFRVARNRIIDRFRKDKNNATREVQPGVGDDGEDAYLGLELPSLVGDPESELTRSTILAALQQALEELPAKQREVFVAHEIDGLSFETISRRDGTPINTLLSQKRYAVLYLRQRLQVLYDELEP
jgi:RNA polymerase sigma factor (sigma-70 family)